MVFPHGSGVCAVRRGKLHLKYSAPDASGSDPAGFAETDIAGPAAAGPAL